MRARPVQVLRRSIQIGIVAAVAVAGIRYATGHSLASVEKYCPFGGIETAWALVTRRSFTCAAGELNLALFLALLALTLVARKSFCSWVCPVGTVSEGALALSKRARLPIGTRPGASGPGGSSNVSAPTGRRRLPIEPSRRLDSALRLLRLPVLAAILFFTWRTGELVFRGYDPYYILFSAHGHDVQVWSYAILASVLVLAFVVPMGWCRYLCPLGIALAPLSRIGWLRLRRDASACTGCRACDRACPHGLDVAAAAQVRSGECTLCLECVEVCPSPGTLAIAHPRASMPAIPRWAVPILVALAAAGGLGGARLFTAPSFERDFTGPGAPMSADASIASDPAPVDPAAADADAPHPAADPDAPRPTAPTLAAGPPETVRLVVRGLRCVDTAREVAGQLEEVPGVLRYQAFASRNEARVTYDPRRVDPEALAEAIEGPVVDEATGEIQFGKYIVLSINGGSIR